MNRSLIPVTNRPLNAETPLSVLEEPVTPIDLFYVRNHFDIPTLTTESFRLRVEGERTLALSLAELMALPATTVRSAMECAGNGRIFMEPKPAGTPWELGAISVAEWTGTPLIEVLRRAGIGAGTVEVLFTGADSGPVVGGQTPYQRSLPIDVASHAETMLVWAMNGEPLTPAHGYPLRLFVPGWYGMASVKWLQEIQLRAEPFDGYFQTHHYVYWDDDYEADGCPLRRMQVRSLICSLQDGDTLPPGEQQVSGIAWSGHGEVVRVEISTVEGEWQEVDLAPAVTPYASQPWSYRWTPAGEGEWTLSVRATDAAGHRQPLLHRANRLGYGNNAVQTVTVKVCSPGE